MDRADLRLRPERYALLRDALGEDVQPAPDGRPWLKACGSCALRPATEQHACTGLDRDSAVHHTARSVFYCVHRTDGDDNHRVCASWAACRSGAALAHRGERS